MHTLGANMTLTDKSILQFGFPLTVSLALTSTSLCFCIAHLVVGMESGEMKSERVKMESIGNDESKVCGTQKKCEIERESLWVPGHI